MEGDIVQMGAYIGAGLACMGMGGAAMGVGPAGLVLGEGPRRRLLRAAGAAKVQGVVAGAPGVVAAVLSASESPSRSVEASRGPIVPP